MLTWMSIILNALTYNCPHGKEVALFPLVEPGCQDTDQHHSRLFLRHGDNCSRWEKLEKLK